MNAPTVVSLFAGCGGSSLGYKLAGFDERLAVEWDDNAVATFRRNFPEVDVYQGDVAKLTVDEALLMARLRPGELDVLDGSPPCQGFSTVGERLMDDARNGLFREYVRLLRGLRPRALVMENVTGMVKGKMRLVFVEILRELREAGYDVSARILNAAHFGVPQARERVIFIGLRSDLGTPPSHPAPTHGAPVTVRQALRGVPDDGTGGRVGPHTKTWQEMRRVPSGQRHPVNFSYHRLAWGAPAPTICKGGGLGHYHVWHPDEHRVITLAECKRLASFPDDFVFEGTVGDAWSRIGNSVPPLLMSAIASHLRTLLSGAAAGSTVTSGRRTTAPSGGSSPGARATPGSTGAS